MGRRRSKAPTLTRARDEWRKQPKDPRTPKDRSIAAPHFPVRSGVDAMPAGVKNFSDNYGADSVDTPAMRQNAATASIVASQPHIEGDPFGASNLDRNANRAIAADQCKTKGLRAYLFPDNEFGARVIASHPSDNAQRGITGDQLRDDTLPSSKLISVGVGKLAAGTMPDNVLVTNASLVSVSPAKFTRLLDTTDIDTTIMATRAWVTANFQAKP